MENFFFIVITALMTLTSSQYFIRRCYIGGQIFVLDSSPREAIILNNHNIRVNNKRIFYNNYNSANIVLLSDLKFDLSNTESFNLAKHNGLKDSNFLSDLDWCSLRCTTSTKNSKPRS